MISIKKTWKKCWIGGFRVGDFMENTLDLMFKGKPLKVMGQIKFLFFFLTQASNSDSTDRQLFFQKPTVTKTQFDLRDLSVSKFVGWKRASLYYPFGGNQTMQIYGNVEGFPLSCIVWVGNILTPGKTSPKKLMDFGAFFWFFNDDVEATKKPMGKCRILT